MHSIKADGKISLGEESQSQDEEDIFDEQNFLLNINTLNTGIEGNEIIIYSVKIQIYLNGDITITGLYMIEAGSSKIKSSPFKKMEN